ncbi:hypothetical protein MNBD_GAMMA09-928 [hydrothermal vent metagenome]|uniref:CheW-like domain-containing protein n=1 Tax=hydrothermal vent metagenome TaxID=652676 RepID=A0A3B0XK01_9ZZZZ
MKGAPAWILEIDTSVSVAVGKHEIVHIVDHTDLVPIAQAPEHCKFVTIWENKLIPVFNIAHWLISDKPQKKQPEYHNIIAIMVFKADNGDMAYGGIHLKSPPSLENISNTQQCELPDNSEKWKSISLSCFKSSDDQSIPILNTHSLFHSRP